MVIGTTAAILGGLSLAGSAVSAISGSNASNKAADAQTQAANEAAAVQREGLQQQQKQFDTTRSDALSIYNQSRGDLSPYRDVGQNALLALSDALGIARPAGHANDNTGDPQFQTDPGYKFAFDQGLKAVDARFPGMSKSGAKAQALDTFGQGVADQQYGNWLSRLGSLASVGQSATGQSTSLGSGLTNTLATVGAQNSGAIQNYSANTGNLLQNAAASRASGYVSSANATNAAIGDGVNNLLALYGQGLFDKAA